MTPEQIRQHLGLRPWCEWADEISSYLYLRSVDYGNGTYSEDLSRRTGRTTRMVVEAVSEVSEGRTVLLVGHDCRATEHLMQMAREALDKLALLDLHDRLRSGGSIRRAPESIIRGIDPLTTWLGVDHAAIEFCPKNAHALLNEWTRQTEMRKVSTLVLRRTAYEVLLHDDPWEDEPIPDIFGVAQANA